MKGRRYTWRGNEERAQAEGLWLRLENPYRKGIRRKPRNPAEVQALEEVTFRRIRDDGRFERIGPRHWRLR